jgi:hypothetical protein
VNSLDGGVPADTEGGRILLLGTVALIVQGLLRRGARRDPDHPPTIDTTTTRRWFATYPVVFTHT